MKENGLFAGFSNDRMKLNHMKKRDVFELKTPAFFILKIAQVLGEQVCLLHFSATLRHG